MIKKYIVPPAGLPNSGLRKKLNLTHWMSTRKNLLRQEVFFLRAARSNLGYLDNTAVTLNICFSLICLYFSRFLFGIFIIP